jgi:hypothetical protein
MHIKFWLESLKGRDHSEDLWVDDNIRMHPREKVWEEVDCMYLAHDGDQWWTFVNTVMKLGAPQKTVNFLTR